MSWLLGVVRHQFELSLAASTAACTVGYTRASLGLSLAWRTTSRTWPTSREEADVGPLKIAVELLEHIHGAHVDERDVLGVKHDGVDPVLRGGAEQLSVHPVGVGEEQSGFDPEHGDAVGRAVLGVTLHVAVVPPAPAILPSLAIRGRDAR
jgi:hypothetical protein